MSSATRSLGAEPRPRPESPVFYREGDLSEDTKASDLRPNSRNIRSTPMFLTLLASADSH